MRSTSLFGTAVDSFCQLYLDACQIEERQLSQSKQSALRVASNLVIGAAALSLTAIFMIALLSQFAS